MDNKKIGGGVILFLIGLASFFFGKKRGLIWLVVFGVLAMGGGVWLFYLGVQDEVVGTVGRYQLGNGKVQVVYAEGYDELRERLSADMIRKDLRRLSFGDDDCGFTVYRVGEDVFNLPAEDFVCGDKIILKYRGGK